MKQIPRISEAVAPNLVPMIDIMFLLLLFFMLSADMGQRELEEVRLPVAASAKDDSQPSAVPKLDRLTINVYHTDTPCLLRMPGSVCREMAHWKTGILGKDYTHGQLQIAMRGEADRERPAATGSSERRVMIRVDAAAPYGLAQESLNACSQAGIYKIEVGAALPRRD